MERDRSLEQSVDYKVYSQRREFEVNVHQTRAMLNDIVEASGELRVLAKLVLSLLAVLQSVNINYEAAVVMMYSTQQLTQVLATPKHGIIDRAKKKKIDLPSRGEATNAAYAILVELENLFDETARYFIKFTGDDSANHMLTSDLVKKKVYNFMDRVYKASYKLCQMYLVKKNTNVGVELVLPSEYEIISNIRSQIEEASVNNDEIVRLARMALLKKQAVLKRRRQDGTPTTNGDKNERRSEEMRQLKETIEDVTQEVSATIDLIHRVTSAAENLVRTGVHMVIPQMLLRSFWRDYIGANVFSVPLNDLIRKLNRFLKDKKEIVETFDNLLNGLKFILLCYNASGKGASHFTSPDTERQIEEGCDECFIDAILIAKIARCVVYNETNIRVVLECVLQNTIPNYKDLFPLFKSVNNKQSGLTFAEYSLNVRYLPAPRSADTQLKPLDDVEIMRHALIPGFYNMVGAPLTGKTHTMLNLCHSHKRLAYKSIVYIDFAYARSRRVAESKVVSQLFLYDVYTSSALLEAFNALLLKFTKEHTLILFDNVSFSNKVGAKSGNNSGKEADEIDSFHIFLKELFAVCNRFINVFSFMVISDKPPSSSYGYTKDVVVIKSRITMPLASRSASHTFAVQSYYQDVSALMDAAMGHCGLLSTLPQLAPLHIIRRLASYAVAAREAQVVDTEHIEEIRNNLTTGEMRDDVISIIAKGLVEAMGRDERLLAYCILIDGVGSFDEGSLWSISKEPFESDLFRWHIAFQGLLASRWLVYCGDMSYSLNSTLTMHRSHDKMSQLLKDVIRMIQLYEYPENSFENIIISSGGSGIKSENDNTYHSEAIIFPTSKDCLLAYYNHYAGELLRVNNLSSLCASYFDTIVKDLSHYYNLFEVFLSKSIDSDTDNIIFAGNEINTQYYSSIINRINESKTLLYTSTEKKRKQHDIDSNFISHQTYDGEGEYNFNDKSPGGVTTTKENKTPVSDKKKKSSSLSEEDLMTLSIKFAGNLYKVLSRMSMHGRDKMLVCMYVVHFLERRGERGLLYFRAVVDLCDLLRSSRGSKQELALGVSVVEQLLGVYVVGKVPERDRGRATVTLGALLDLSDRHGEALKCYENGIIIWGVQEQMSSGGWGEGGLGGNVDYLRAMSDMERIKGSRGGRKSRDSEKESLGNRSFSMMASRATKRRAKDVVNDAVYGGVSAASEEGDEGDDVLDYAGEEEECNAAAAGCKCAVM